MIKAVIILIFSLFSMLIANIVIIIKERSKNASLTRANKNMQRRLEAYEQQQLTRDRFDRESA